jgi:glucose-1-phosphate adenylyltransferase
LVLAGGKGSRLSGLTRWRAKPAVPFGGKFRIIDFTLSNCVNSGIRRVGVLTQYKAHSLLRHLQRGWGFLRGAFDEFIEILPASQRVGDVWYAGTADAIYQNLDIIMSHNPEYVIVLAGDHVYKMDYGHMLAYHADREADMTVGCIEVPLADARDFGVMSVDVDYRIKKFAEKPEYPEPMPGHEHEALASMGIYIFNTEFLCERLIKDAQSSHSSRDFGKDIIPDAIGSCAVYAYPFREAHGHRGGYWRDVGTVDAYWKANMELVGVSPELNLYDAEWPIWTYQEQLPPAKFVFDTEERRGMAVDSMVSGGCIISGALIRRALLFSNVRVDAHSVIEDSVILPEVSIGPSCQIRRAVIDKQCQIPAGTAIGFDLVADRQRFFVSSEGIVLVIPEMLGQEFFYRAGRGTA